MADAFADVERVTLAAINTDKEYDLAAKYHVTSVPTIIWFPRGTSMSEMGERSFLALPTPRSL